VTLVAGNQIGKYVVRQKLAEGGMAEIYLCTARGPEGFEKEVVIKRVRAYLASDPGFVKMFIAEAQLSSRLNHANVVQIFDFDKHEDTYYLAMELVRGCSLWELRRRCKEQLEPIPPVLVAQIGMEVARGLHYAHRLKVDGEPIHLVHRDVTPQNVLLSFDGAVKLTDFGIAKAGTSFTAPGMLKGKFAYMSPEQARGETVDARTDIFALGVVLWELLTGGRLFEGDSEVAVLRAVQQSIIPPPARLNPDVPAELDAVVRKALERDPAARYQSAFELERALGEVTLRHAKSVDDTDVGAFVRRIFNVGFTSVVQVQRDASGQILSTGDSASAPAPREATAVMPGTGSRSQGGVGLAASPDEDIHAPTHVLQRAGSSPGTPVRATPSGATPALVPLQEARVPSGSVPSVTAPLAELAPSPPAAPVRQASSGQVPTVSVPGMGGASAAPRRTGLLVGGAVGLVIAVGGVVAMTRTGSTPAPTQPPAVAQPATPAEGAGVPAVKPPEPVKPETLVAAAEDAGTPVDPNEKQPPVVATGAQDAGTKPPQPPTDPKAEVVQAKGKLKVRAIPFATVLLDGGKLGEVTGSRIFDVAAGEHKLTFVHPAGSKSFTITVEPNGLVSRDFRATSSR
jgi:serine/threonine-protein kinase